MTVRWRPETNEAPWRGTNRQDAKSCQERQESLGLDDTLDATLKHAELKFRAAPVPRSTSS